MGKARKGEGTQGAQFSKLLIINCHYESFYCKDSYHTETRWLMNRFFYVIRIPDEFLMNFLSYFADFHDFDILIFYFRTSENVEKL